MIIITIILILIAFWLGVLVGKKLSNKSTGRPEAPGAEEEQAILEFTKENGKVANADIQELLNVSAATAERYLQKLEEQNELKQQGKTGTNVTYILS